MIHSALRLALATTALISLASASVTSAQVNTQAPLERQSAAAPEKGSAVRVHRSATSTVRQRTTRVAAYETTVRTVHGATVRTARTTIASGGHWVWLGGRYVWRSYGFAGGGYAYGPAATGAVYGGTYGVAAHSCWWYRHYDPANLLRWCPRYYGSSYGYNYSYSAPSYSYRYGYSAPTYSYSYRYRATRTASTRVISTRVANVSSARLTSLTHGMVVTQGGPHVAVTRPAETGTHVRIHAQAGAQVRAPSAGADVRKQTSP
jgi:hypothetical protein